MTPLIFALAFLAGLLLLEGGYNLIRGSAQDRDRQLKTRLRELARRGREAAAPTAQGEGTMLRARGGSAGGPLKKIERMIELGGSTQTLTRFLALSLALGALGFVGLYTFVGTTPRSLPGVLLGSVPLLLVSRAAEKRMRRFAEQLPEGLELLTRSLRAGHALSAGFHLVGEELDDPVGTEFAVVAEELRFGLDLRDALENLTQRVENPDLPYFTTAVLIQRQTGGNLAELLDNLGTLLRERIQFHNRVHALTAQGRGAANFLAAWLPFMIGVLMIVAPAFLTPLFVESLGQLALVVALTIDVAAFVIARRIANVEV